MEVYERINELIKAQNITKREFAKRLVILEPKLKSTGEVPTEKAIYGYLNGTSSIKIELIPYIAEALRIPEQELFTSDKKSRRKFFNNLLKTATEDELNILKEKLNSSVNINSYVKEATTKYGNKNKLNDELISLLPYSPTPLTIAFINKLKDIKEFTKLV